MTNLQKQGRVGHDYQLSDAAATMAHNLQSEPDGFEVLGFGAVGGDGMAGSGSGAGEDLNQTRGRGGGWCGGIG